MKIDTKKEADKIIAFLKVTFAKQGIHNAVIGMSGGVDSAVSFLLLTKTLPKDRIFPVHLPYFSSSSLLLKTFSRKNGVPEKNFYELSIKEVADTCASTLESNSTIRLGNIMARIRMIFLFDLAKKHNAMVVGTENKSEQMLGYFTRFGDSASDIEPIQHLYKTQVYTLAKYLGVPQEIIDIPPTANLWEGQTDEGEFGFTYQEADQVLYYYFDQKLPVEEIVKKGLVNAEKILKRVRENEYKHKTPYILEI